jgi:protein TonB
MTPTASMTGAQVARWPGGRPTRRPSLACCGGAMLLHAAVGLLALASVHLAVAPPPSGGQGIAMVFTPPPHAAPPPIPRPLAPALVRPPDPPAPPVAGSPPLQPVLSPVVPPPPLSAAVPPPPQALAAIVPPPPPAPPPKQRLAKPHAAASAPTHRVVATSARRPVPAPSSLAPSPSRLPSSSPAPSANPAPARLAAPSPLAVDWQHALASWLAAHKTYPDEARRAGAQGSVVLRFTVDRSGRVLAVERLDTAAPAVLGAAAEAMLRGATVPPFPDTMPQDRITITVRVHYALTD